MYKVSKDQCIYSMNAKQETVLKVSTGSTVEFETYDCFENQITDHTQSIDNLDWSRINPATGPLYVEGAEEGDTLKIEILKIDVGEKGVMGAIPGVGVMGDKVENPEMKIVPIKDNKVIFNDDIHLPLEPMIGVIGVAPKHEDISCGTPGHHGGNMDNKKIREGATLYLPIFTEGALLSIGDLHAVMGDGEVMVSGVEVCGRVQVKVEVIKGISIENPLLEDKENIYTIASDEDLFTATKMATEDMQKIVMKQLNISFNEAGMLLSAAGNVEICQIVDPLLTVRFAMPKKIINKLY
ncbi:MAG: acetamidase/formamidase family protein [Clostridiaceae bacterium]|nr:acetamidase/formamidase family protein [Clostridiaceae bacterium]